MVYKFVYSESHDLRGYIDHSLSIFNTSDYKEEWGAVRVVWMFCHMTKFDFFTEKRERPRRLPVPWLPHGLQLNRAIRLVARLLACFCSPTGVRCHFRTFGFHHHSFHAVPDSWCMLFGTVFSLIWLTTRQNIFQVPRELKTQMQREQLLAKEAKYQNGVVKAQEYEDLLTAIRDNSSNTVAKGLWTWMSLKEFKNHQTHFQASTEAVGVEGSAGSRSSLTRHSRDHQKLIQAMKCGAIQTEC